MSLKYKVLWIDDTRTSAEAKIEGIKDFLDGEGFSFESILFENAENIDNHLQDHELDIVVTDFNLPGIEIKELIQKIRSQHNYIDIILYSENPPANFDEVAKSFEGIFSTTRDSVEDTIIAVIKETLRRTQNVNNMRGIVISEAIDIENQVEDIIIEYFSGREKYLATILLDSDKGDDFGRKISFLGTCLKEIVGFLNVTIQDNNGNNTTEIELLAEVKPLHIMSKKLVDDICMPRNMLAHVEHQLDEDHTPFLKSLKSGYKQIKIDYEWCKNIRKDILKHSYNLANLKNFITKWNAYRIPK